MAKTLGQFTVTAEADGFMLHIEDEDGETTSYAATLDQLEEIVDAVEEQIEMADDEPLDDEDDEVAGDDEE